MAVALGLSGGLPHWTEAPFEHFTHAAPDLGRADRRARLGDEPVSGKLQTLADWIAVSADNHGLNFVVVDKEAAKVYVFDDTARLVASSSVLLGAARGDDSVPGIGARAIAAIEPAERTTPAGRFIAERGLNALGHDVIWIDYQNAISMHRVINTDLSEHRLERLASPSIADKRISYGCINVPAEFFDAHLVPIFARHQAVVYVMPETRPLEEVFHMPAMPTVPGSDPEPQPVHRGPAGHGGRTYLVDRQAAAGAMAAHSTGVAWPMGSAMCATRRTRRESPTSLAESFSVSG